MPCDLHIKVPRLISDFRAVLALTEFIEHELEKRIVARLGLIKIDALIAIAGTCKNQIGRVAGPGGGRQTIAMSTRASGKSATRWLDTCCRYWKDTQGDERWTVR
jgi:hypothetical protein